MGEHDTNLFLRNETTNIIRLDIEMDILNDPGIYWKGFNQTFDCHFPTNSYRFTLFQLTEGHPRLVLVSTSPQWFYPIAKIYDNIASEFRFSYDRNPLAERWLAIGFSDYFIEYTIYFNRFGHFQLQAIITELDTAQVYIINPSSISVEGIAQLILKKQNNLFFEIQRTLKVRFSRFI